ncbi:MAG TPA: hypothetical protein VNW30_00275 [Opitutaceae bacterium]|jgi:hypothetical protein|nr:hypothetical protein [Opitutaceae bacterium]
MSLSSYSTFLKQAAPANFLKRAAPANFFKKAAPAPDVVLLPDTLFFVRAISVAAGITPAELSAQAELAIEALAPFPLAQLYYGFYHPPGTLFALLYAAYRKRFTTEQTAAWARADLVIPTFVALLGGEVKSATTLLLSKADDLTLLHWADGKVPEKILTYTVAPDMPEEERAIVRDEMIRYAGECLNAINLSATPVPEPVDDEEKFVFRSGDFVSRLPLALADQLDVRDKVELALRRQQRARDLVLWRVFVTAAALIALCLFGEFALAGGKLWEKARLARVEAQRPAVEKIDAANRLVDSIGARSTDRLMPFEMISLISSVKPASVQFIRATTSGNYMLEIEAQTDSPGDVGSYQTALNGLPACSRVEVSDQRTRDGISTFKFIVTFKPEALKPTAT